MQEKSSNRPVEPTTLAVLWATLGNSLAPELNSALAKDRAKRADAALLRLVAGYQRLPALREAFAARYQALLERARALQRELSSGGAEPVAGHAKAIPLPPDVTGNPVFVGIPEAAAELEALLNALVNALSDGARIRPRVDELMRSVIALEAEFRGAYEQQVAAVAANRGAGAASGGVLTIDSMQRYLERNANASADVRVSAVNEIPGGRSKRTVLVSLEKPGRLPGELVLRIDTGRNAIASVIDEFPLLDRIAKRGLPVPEPLWLERSTELVGAPFIVFRRMPGAAAGDLIEGAHRKEPATARALARALGRVHAAGSQLLDNAAERGSAVPHTRALLTSYFNLWRAQKPFPSLTVETAFMWLFRRLNDGLGEASIVHADTGFHNMLLDDAGNGCLLDWEFAHFGDPAEDLASCRPAVEQCMPWNEFIDEYRKAGGLSVSEFRLGYFEIWRPLRNATLCGGVLHSLMHGRADDIDPVTIGLSTFGRLQADLAASLNRIADRAL